MLESKEKKKQVVMGVIFLIFVMTAYVTFFKGTSKTGGPLPDPGGRKIQLPKQLTPAPEITAVDTVLLGFLGGKEPDSVFQERIRDIFQVPVSLKTTGSPKPFFSKAASTEKGLSAEERDVVKKALHFKGAILHGGQSVAIINHSFFHIGDRINDYQVVSISDRSVTIASTRGKINIEIINYD